jgi:hypothetical protein
MGVASISECGSFRHPSDGQESNETKIFWESGECASDGQLTCVLLQRLPRALKFLSSKPNDFTLSGAVLRTTQRVATTRMLTCQPI